MRLSALLMVASLGAAAGSMPVSATEPGNNVASMRVYSRSTEVNWYGVGAAVTSVNLCVVSTTGRFRLEVTSARGGALTGPASLPYMVTFRDGAGMETTQSTETQAALSFEGSASPAADCTSGPNSQLRLRIPEPELVGGVAGSYFDELQFSVVPL